MIPPRRIDSIDALLPQTQCTQCGYPGCRPYAEAIAAGVADFNQCPPGGEATIQALAGLLEQTPRPLNPSHGASQPPLTASIIEADCIGCTKCIQACPVDAIVGAAKRMHTVINAECTGCELCLPPCPVDCIELHPVTARPAPTQARQRYQNRQRRLLRQRTVKKTSVTTTPTAVLTEPAQLSYAEKQAVIAAAVRRAKARRAVMTR